MASFVSQTWSDTYLYKFITHNPKRNAFIRKLQHKQCPKHQACPELSHRIDKVCIQRIGLVQKSASSHGNRPKGIKLCFYTCGITKQM